MAQKTIAVIGSGNCRHDSTTYQTAIEVGRLVATAGCVLVTGGLLGVMEAASRGASEFGGVVIGILPGPCPTDGNAHLTTAIATGMGDARNVIIANTADGFIAVGGGYGTLSEIAFVLKRQKPIVHLDSWELDGRVRRVETPQAAMDQLLGEIA